LDVKELLPGNVAAMLVDRRCVFQRRNEIEASLPEDIPRISVENLAIFDGSVVLDSKVESAKALNAGIQCVLGVDRRTAADPMRRQQCIF